MKKVISILLLAAIVVMTGCMSTGPDFDSIPADQGVVMPYMMVGEQADGVHDSANYLFTSPKAIAADSQGNIYVGAKQFPVSKFTADGEFVAVVAKLGTEKGDVGYAKGLAVNSKDQLLACDAKQNKITIFDADGNWVGEFGEASDEPGVPGKFHDVGPLAVDADDNVYVSDAETGVHVFDADGNFVKLLGIVDEGDAGSEEFGWIAVDSEVAQLYVADDGRGEVDVYDLNTGDYKFTMGGLGEGNELWAEDVEGLAVGKYNLLYAVDEAGGNIKCFTADGTYVTKWGQTGLYDGEMASSESIAFDPANNRIVVADDKNYRVISFSLADLKL